jgi:hypothetical protein
MLFLTMVLVVLSSCIHRSADEPADFGFTYSVMGRGAASEKELARFLTKGNRTLKRKTALEMARLYIAEGAAEGVNSDLAFCQMCLETGFLKYGGDVRPEQFNFCGLGATGGGNPGLSFPDRQTGVRAHIQHLKAYGSEDPLTLETVDPRFRFVKRGRARILFDLAGTWAADTRYGEKLALLMEKLFRSVQKNRRINP